MRLLHFMSIALVVGLQAVHTAAPKGNETDQTDLSILSPHNLGTSAGTVSGVGLAYRKWFTDGWGFQVTGFPYYEKTTYGTSADLNIGGLALKSFYNTDNASRSGLFSANVYGYLGGSTRYERNEYTWDQYDYTWDGNPATQPRSSVTHTDKTRRHALGSGFGFEVGIWRIKWNLMTGVGAYKKNWNTSSTDSNFVGPQTTGPQTTIGLIPSVETALFFGF